MSSYYDGQTAQFIAVAAQNMPKMTGDTMQWWIDNPLELQEVLAGLGKKPCPELKVWKTIKLCTGLRVADDFRKAIKGCGMKIGDWADDILGKPEFVVATEETEVDLVKVSVAELGFKKDARRDRIYERTKKLGLELCPPEVGPQLRLQYKDQPNGERILIGVEPICDSGGDLRVFYVERRDSELWLDGHYGDPDNFWHPGRQWVFVRPRKYQN